MLCARFDIVIFIQAQSRREMGRLRHEQQSSVFELLEASELPLVLRLDMLFAL